MIATRDTTVQEAARLMRENHVGDLVVVVALDLDPTALSVGDIMSAELETAPEGQGVFETIHQMRSAGVRRIPVVTRQGTLVGIVSIDDLIQLLAEEMT